MVKCLVIFEGSDGIGASIRSPASDDEMAVGSAQPHIWGFDSDVTVLAVIAQCEVVGYTNVDFESDRHRIFIEENELEDAQLYLPKQSESLADNTDFDAVTDPITDQ